MMSTGPGDGVFDWLAELPLPVGPPDMHMGLRVLSPDQWLPTDALTPVELRWKAELLDAHSGLVMLDAGWEHAVDELLSLMERHLGTRLDRGRRTPLEAAARAVPDDLLLMANEGDGWRLIGGALVFPNQWTLADKMGGTLAEIHEPVDGYAELLSARVDRFFDRFTAGRLVWRRNWFFHDIADFFQPAKRVPLAFTEATRAAELFVRSEWQTLRRLSTSGVIVFTVKTQIAPISELVARPDVAVPMIRYIEAASSRALDNRDALGREQAIVDYLRSAVPESAAEMQQS